MKRPTGTGWPAEEPAPASPAPLRATSDPDTVRYDSMCLIHAALRDDAVASAAIVFLVADPVDLALDLASIAAEFVQQARGKA